MCCWLTRCEQTDTCIQIRLVQCRIIYIVRHCIRPLCTVWCRYFYTFLAPLLSQNTLTHCSTKLLPINFARISDIDIWNLIKWWYFVKSCTQTLYLCITIPFWQCYVYGWAILYMYDRSVWWWYINICWYYVKCVL